MMMAPAGAATSRIFISYRRDDTGYPAGWLFERLAARFGAEQVFKDVDSIQLGDRFAEVINTAVGSCDVLLALIGDRWLTSKDGRRRLEDPNDFVRLEIETALTRNVRVIPILVGGAQLPQADELPASLAKLVERQALELSAIGFNTGIGHLLGALDEALIETQGPQSDQPALPSEDSEKDTRHAGEEADRQRELATIGGGKAADRQPQEEPDHRAQQEADRTARAGESKAQARQGRRDASGSSAAAEDFRAVVLGFDSADVNVRRKTAGEVKGIAAFLELEDVLGFCRSRKTAERVGGAIALGLHLRSSKETRGDRRVLSALGELLTDGRSSLVRYRAAEVLQLSPMLVPTYDDVLGNLAKADENSWVRRMAAKALQAAKG